MGALLEVDGRGLHCQAGGFHVDPWQPVAEAVLTHAHADHASPGSGRYHCAAAALPLLRSRLGPDAELVPHPFHEPFALGTTRVSFHPSGHILGAAQVRVEEAGEVWVVSGDYKREADPTCPPFEPVRCDTFVTEATFGLPVFRWEPALEVVRSLHAWWEENRARGRASVLFCYALGKAQRVLAELRRFTDAEVHVHGAVESRVEHYRAQGIPLLPTRVLTDLPRGVRLGGALVLAPPSARRTPWMRRLGEHETAFASGWMRIRGNRRRRGDDRGFVLSDHADWPALLRTVRETGASRVRVTHGFAEPFARYLRETGLDAEPLVTPFAGEEAEA